MCFFLICWPFFTNAVNQWFDTFFVVWNLCWMAELQRLVDKLFKPWSRCLQVYGEIILSTLASAWTTFRLEHECWFGDGWVSAIPSIDLALVKMMFSCMILNSYQFIFQLICFKLRIIHLFWGRDCLPDKWFMWDWCCSIVGIFFAMISSKHDFLRERCWLN